MVAGAAAAVLSKPSTAGAAAGATTTVTGATFAAGDTAAAVSAAATLGFHRDPLAPRLPLIVSNDLPTMSNTTSSRPSGYTVQLLPNDSHLGFRGFLAGTRSVYGNATWINVSNGHPSGTTAYSHPNYFADSPAYSIEFDLYGDGVVFDMLPLNTATAYYQMYIDGMPISLSPSSMPFASMTRVWLKAAWPAVAQRRIRLDIPFGLEPGALMGVWLKNTGVITPPPALPKIAAIGDSWVYGSGVDLSAGRSWIETLRLLTGWDVYNIGQPATGYVADGGAPGVRSPFGSSYRLNAVTDINPDIIIVAGTSNDDNNSSLVQAAAESMYSSLYSACPDATLIVIGPQNTSTSLSVNRAAVHTAVLSACSASPAVSLVIDPLSPVPWIDGSGTVASPGSGNASLFVGGVSGSDGGHLNYHGYDVFARRVFAALSVL